MMRSIRRRFEALFCAADRDTHVQQIAAGWRSSSVWEGPGFPDRVYEQTFRRIPIHASSTKETGPNQPRFHVDCYHIASTSRLESAVPIPCPAISLSDRRSPLAGVNNFVNPREIFRARVGDFGVECVPPGSARQLIDDSNRSVVD